MSDTSSRRVFLRWLGLGAGSAAVAGLGSGCADQGPGASDTSVDEDVGSQDSGTDGGGGDGGQCEETASDVEGPFHEEDAPQRTKLAPDDEPGTRIVIEGTVYESDCETPVEGALLDVWHANDDGDYYDASDDYRLRGQLQSDAQGSYEIQTIRPGRYPDAGGLRPRHVHFIVSSPPHGALTTQMYFAGDPRLEDDSCGICSSDEASLIVDFQSEMRDGTEVLVGQFDIILG